MRKLALVTIALLGMTLTRMISMPCLASDGPEIACPDCAKIASHRDTIQSHQLDLLSIAKSTRSIDDKNMLMDIVDVAGQTVSKASHLWELLRIKSMMVDEVDKKTISDFINEDIKSAVDGISSDVERVNRNMANLKSPAAATDAIKLKDDLLGLKELLSNL